MGEVVWPRPPSLKSSAFIGVYCEIKVIQRYCPKSSEVARQRIASEWRVKRSHSATESLPARTDAFVASAKGLHARYSLIQPPAVQQVADFPYPCIY